MRRKSNNRNVVVVLLMLVALFAVVLAGAHASRNSLGENGKRADSEKSAASRNATGQSSSTSVKADGSANTPLTQPALGPISPSVISGGGGTSTGDSFTLDATLGEVSAGNQQSGGTFTLDGGFWNMPQDLSIPTPSPTPTPSPSPSPTPTLGNYADATVQLGANTTVTPDAAPTNTTSLTVATSTNFKGQLEGDPTTGVVRVTDAHPAGTYTVTVTGFDGSGATTTKTFMLTVTTPVTCNSVSFAGATDFAVESGPTSVAIGDFNGDGQSDLAVANSASSSVSILLGSGTGSFSAATNFTVGAGAASVAIGDFNGDGKSDLAVANQDSNNVSILLGSGTGSFSAATNFAVGSGPVSVAIGDFNGDGKSDLATANIVSNNVSILLGSGTGSFSAATNFAVGSFPASVAIGDFNGDGKSDLAVANQNSNNVSILLGSGTGSFSAPTNFAVGSLPAAVAIDDFNGDGKSDLATANFSSSNLSILLGSGTGSFSAATNFAAGSTPRTLAIGDFNGDGQSDLVVANYSPSNVSILLGSGTGSFGAATDFAVESAAAFFAIGDFNGDGKSDLATANDNADNVSVLLGQCQSTAPEINVKGNNVSIVDGDTTPSTTDDTDFGSIAVTGGMVTHTFTIENLGTSALTITSFTLTGPNISDFALGALALASPIPAGNSATFTVTFDPSATGLRTATVSIGNDDSDENPYDFAIQGTGTAPEINVKGNSVSIVDGDTTPSATDDTDFGSTAGAWSRTPSRLRTSARQR